MNSEAKQTKFGAERYLLQGLQWDWWFVLLKKKNAELPEGFLFLLFFPFLKYWICYSIASVLCFGFLATRYVGSELPNQLILLSSQPESRVTSFVQNV